MQKGFVRKHIGNSHWSIPNKCYYVGFRYSKHAIKSTRETLAERYFEYHCQIKWVRNLVRDMLHGGFSKRNDNKNNNHTQYILYCIYKTSVEVKIY